jgi:hypothetical protein
MSRRIVVIAHDSNKEYSFFAPIVEWAWKELSWEVITIDANRIIGQSSGGLEKYSSAIISQCSRLYAAQLFNLNEGDYLLTSDVDMIPLGQFNQFFKYDPDEITSYGRDLTDYHYPICYIGMRVKKWREVMELNGFTICKALERDLAAYKNQWTTDQDIITERLAKFPVKIVPRTCLSNGMAYGRLDRSGWQKPRERVDCHALRPGYSADNWPRIKQALIENFDYPAWIDEYVKNFQK